MFFYLFFAAGNISVNTIPSSLGEVVANGYPSFRVTTTITNPTRYSSCSWKYRKNSEEELIFYRSSTLCSSGNNANFVYTCSRNGSAIDSTLTFKQPLSTGYFFVQVYCVGQNSYPNNFKSLPTTYVRGKFEI